VFGLQVFINIAVVTGLAPTTGQPLPFISAGGSSLLVFMVSMGILLNISRDVDI
jgi:cell division protein FtsW